MHRFRQTAVRLAAAAAFAGAATAISAQAADCPEVRDVLVTNGDIHTMDAADRVVKSVRILDDEIVAVGTGRLGATRCTQRIDLRGAPPCPASSTATTTSC